MTIRNDGEPFFYSAKQTWYVWKDGRKRSLGVRGRENRREAFAALTRFGTSSSSSPTATDTPTPTSPTSSSSSPTVDNTMVGLVVSEVVSRFLSHVEEVGKPNTIRTYRRFLVPFAKRFANVPANALTSSQVEAYAKRPTWSDTTRSHTLKTIQTALRFAGVTLTLKTPRKSSRGIEAVVSEDDVNAIVDASRGDFGFFYRFLSLTGCRPAEAMSLRFDHVQVTQGVAILSEHKTAQKTGKKRLIFLSDDALAIVERQRLRYASGHVFQTSTRKAFTLNNACNILWRINKRIGTKATLYGMRHTFATRLLAEGVPDAHVAALLGHASTAMLHKHYAHVTAHAGVLREALRKSFGDNK